MNTTHINDTSLYDGAEERGAPAVVKQTDRRHRAPATLGEALRRPGYLFTKWPWLALGNIIVGIALASVLGSVILPLIVLSLVPQIRNLLWPALLRVEVWRLRLIDRPGADEIGPPIDRLADEGGTPTFAQFAHLALVIFLLIPFTVGVAFLPAMFTMLFSPWPFFDGTPVEALGDNATNAEVGQGMYDTFIAPLPTWLLVTWIVVAAVVFIIALLYAAGLWAWATGRLGRTLMAVLVTLVALRGLRGAVGAFSLIVPVIVALTLLFGGMALARYGVSLPAFGAAEGSNPLMRSAAFGAVTFAFYNFFGSVGILAPLGEAASSGKAARRGVLLGTALLLLIAYSVLLAVMAVPETADAELPMLALAYGLSRPLGYVYGILLLLCMYGSALSMTVAITTYAAARSERVEKRRGWFILALGALGYAASSVGFGDLISVVYPVFGYCSSVFIVCLLVHAAQTRKKEYNFFENSGTKEEEISS